MTATINDVLTLDDAAELLRVPVEGLRRELEAGRLPGRTVAGEWRCGRAALLAWLDRPEPARQTFDWESYSTNETPEEQQAFLDLLARQRREADRAARAAERKSKGVKRKKAAGKA